jgi:signal transduction histidine kinase
VDEDGVVGGLFCPSTDVSASVLNARRLGTLSRLSADALREPTVAGACATAIGTLADNPADLPFVLLYLADGDGKGLRLGGTAGLPDADAVPSDADAGPFPVARACRDGEAMRVDLDGIAGVQVDLPTGLSNQPLREALVLPLATAGHERTLGALVLGVSPVRRLDAEYRTFFDLVAAQVTAALQNAGAIEEQRRRVDMLAELDRAKTAFFSNISHEFRTPLTLMLGPVEDSLADADAPLPDAQRDRLQLVRRNALRLERLVNTLLDFSRVQAGRMQAHFTLADLPALTADLASGFRSVIENAGLAFDVRCAPLLRPVRLDVGMWEKIVLNLLSNAFKFTFEGAIAVTVEACDGGARVTVRDTGIGIAPEHLGTVFERFQRIEGARSRSNEGSGIGLALVRDLVELQGGTIAVDSAPGQGSAFIVTLPFAPEGAAGTDVPAAPTGRVLAAFAEEAGRWLPAPPGTPAPRPAEEPVVLSMARVLVADDNADMRDYLARLLGQHWEVSVAADGVEALAMVRHERPDVVVADVMMPRLDGFGLIARLRADRELADTPVVLVSARAGEEARIEGLEKGANDYLVKPFGARELITRVESQVMQARMRALERAHAARLAAIFRQVPAGIAILRGPHHVFELVNDHYQDLVGPRPVVGQPLLAALPELEGQGIRELLDGVRASGRPYVGRSQRFMLARGAEPEERFFDFVYQPIVDGRGSVEGIAVVAFEVTELARARRDAEVANNAKDDFLAMLGHELRNPLAPILIALELIRARRMPGHERELAIIERQARHLVRLVDDLLDVARIARGKIELRPEYVELGRLVALAVEASTPLVAERSHHLVTDVAPGGLLLHGDPIRLTQVLSNLLTNAAKYTNPGGRIHVRARAEAGHAVLQVEDNGIGISPEMLPRLFDKFVQERQALDRSRGGLGLGLAIVKEIVALHGGTVTAYSRGLGHGSVFELRLPLADTGAGTDGGETDAGPARGRTGRRVLLVDDNTDVLDAMRALLELSGHAVTALADPHAALALPDDYAPDVALLDIGLPGMNGYELLAALRARPGCAGTDFIALSGYGQPEDRARSLGAGFCAHLVKPPAPQELAALLDTLARRRAGELAEDGV